MQKGFIKKILLFLFFAFVHNCSAAHYISDIRITDTRGINNCFFTRAESIISDIESRDVFNKEEMASDSIFSQLKDFKFIIKNLNSYNFKLKTMSHSILLSIFTKIDSSIAFLVKEDSVVLNDDIKNVLLSFNLLRDGVYYELSLEHLLELKKIIIKDLDEIISLIDYWKFKLENKNIQGHIEDVFKKNDVKIKSKLMDLFYLKNRMATFLGKIEELMDNHFVILDSISGDDFDFDRFKSLNKEFIFCISSFFMQGFNPDSNDYVSRLEAFTQTFSENSFRKFLANHMNILLLEEGSRHILNAYRTPGFFRRNWLKLFVFGTAGAVAGVYICKNWDDISLKATQIINDSVDSLTGSYSNFIGMVNTKLDLNIPGGNNDRQEINLGQNKISEKVENDLEELKSAIDAFSNSGQKLFGQEFEKGVELQGMLEQMVKLRKQLDGSVSNISGSVKEFTEGVSVFIYRANESLAALGIGEPTDEMSEYIDWDSLPQEIVPTDGKIASIVNWGLGVGMGEEKTETIFKALRKVDLLMRRLEFSRDHGVDTEARESLVNVVRKLNTIFDIASTSAEGINGYLKMYEGLVYGMIGLILESTYKMILSTAKEADGVIDKISVMVNLVKAIVPAVLSVIIIRKILKNKMLRRQTDVNNIIINIYRILNINNKVSVDVRIGDLSYKDQGMLVFFVNCLDLDVSSFFKKGKSKLVNLVDDLKNPNFTVAQKLDFIKAGWGYNLFETNSFG